MSPCQDPLPTTAVDKAVLPASPSQSTARTLNSAQQTSGACWRVMLPFWMLPMLLNDSSSQDWPLNQRGAQTINLCMGHATGWEFLEGCASPAGRYPCLDMPDSDHAFFFVEELPSLYLRISWLWSISWLVGLYNLPKPNYPLTCCQDFSD